MTKVCIRCGEEKELELFTKAKKYADGRRKYCKKCHSEYMTKYYKKNPDKHEFNKGNPKSTRIKKNWEKHRVSHEDYIKLYNKYDGKCHSCNEKEATHIDHDHKCCPDQYSCGKCVRGILCHNCNSALGLLGDNKDKVNKLFNYILGAEALK